MLPSGAQAFDRDQAVEVLNSSRPLSSKCENSRSDRSAVTEQSPAVLNFRDVLIFREVLF
jgi:hypothetical protein